MITGFLRRDTVAPTPSESSLMALAAALDVEARGLADALTAGEVRSIFRGWGMEPRSVRRYEAGDDARTVDWRVTARRGELHVREVEEERDLAVLIVVDRSASLHGLVSDRSSSAATTIAAAIAHVGSRSGHPVGALTFTDRVECFLAPGRGRDQAVRVTRALVEPPRAVRTDLPGALRSVGRLLGARGMVVIISDFEAGNGGGAETELAALAQRHDVVPVILRTPRASSLGNLGLVRVRDPETDRACWTSGDALEKQIWITGAAIRLGLVALDVDPERPLAPQLAPRFGGRAARVR